MSVVTNYRHRLFGSLGLVTHEDGTISNEEIYYENVDAGLTTRPGDFYNSDDNGDKVQLLRKSTQAIGAGKLLKVMAKDKLHIKVDYYMPNDATDNSSADGLGSLLSAFSALINGSSFTGVFHGEGSTVTTALSSSTPFTNFLAAQSGSGGTMPKAYLNIVFFDEQFKFVEQNSEVIQVTTKGSGQTITRISGSAKEAVKNGYVYVYVNNESNNFVYFDNLQVTHERGPILEETHYYPFGLTMAGISSKALSFGEPDNKIKFQNQEFASREFSDGSGLEMYEFKWRMHDPQIGRFWQVDPLAEDYVYNSTYAFSENKVISHVELEGLEAKLAIAGNGNNTSYSKSDVNAFNARAKNLEKTAGFVASQVRNGDQFVDQLRQGTSNEGSVGAVVVFAHASQEGIYLDKNDGVYRGSDTYAGANSANVSEIKEAVGKGEIKFAENAVVVLGGCNCAKNDGSDPLAVSMTKELGVTTYAATGPVYAEVKGGKETGRLKTDGSFVKTEKKTEIRTVSIPIPMVGPVTVPIPVTNITQTNMGKTIDPKQITKQ